MNIRLVFAFLVSITFLSGRGQSCLPNGISFNRQAAVDAFPINYPGCTSIEGDLFIGGFYEDPSDIQNVDSLIGLTSIGGDLIISGYYGNDDFHSLIGFSNLSVINGDLILEMNPSLTSLEGLNQLVHVGGNLIIRQMPVSTLSDLGGLVDISGDMSIVGTLFQNLTGLKSLNSVNGDILIGSNAYLTELTGMEWLSQSNGALDIQSNSSLESLTGLENLTVTNGYLKIGNNNSLKDLTGLANLVHIGGGLDLWDNNRLNDFTGLNSLTSIGGSLTIYSNPRNNLAGLDNLSSIGGGLFISWIGWLTNLDELGNLTSIGGIIQIDDNGALLNLDGLNNIQANSISGLKIRYNLSLSSCNARSICDYLAAPSGIVEISNNASGCNSADEVLQSCDFSVPEFPDSSLRYQIYPNPSTGKFTLTFTSSESIDFHFSLTNIIGQRIIDLIAFVGPGLPWNYNWNAATMPAGVYLFQISANGKTASGKLIIH